MAKASRRLMATDGPRHRSVEMAVGAIIVLFGLITIFGSLQVGITWGAEGPKSGFFPFYLGLFIVAASAVNIWNAYQLDAKPLFANWGQLGQVLAVVIPTAVYVAVLPFTGIYISSMVLIAGFMILLGSYSYAVAAAVGIGVPVAVYVLFEKWFLVPLPKGPIEMSLGL